MASLKDVAKLAGVSIATVSYVLRGTKVVSSEVERRVRQAVRALDYQPNRTAQALRTGRSGTLGLIVPDLTNPFFPLLVQAIETTGRALGYALILIDSQNDPATERQGLELLASYNVEGAIWIPVADAPGEPWRFPTVVVDRPLEGFDVVQADHAQGGELLAAYAVRLGHRRVGLLSGPRTLASAAERRDGFLRAAAGKLEVVWEREAPFALELPPEVVQLLWRREATLVVCSNDTLAVGVVRAVHERGWRVPDDLSVLGFDDVPWAALVEPPLSTVRQPVAELGRRTVARLHARIQAPETPLCREVLPVTLIERRSARPVRETG